VRLLLSRPEIAYLRCSDCVRWIYDLDTGRRSERIPGHPDARPPGVPTPCWKCPKCPGEEKTPKIGLQSELSLKNWKCLRAYFENKASPVPVDAVARKNFGMIESTIKDHDQLQTRIMVSILRK